LIIKILPLWYSNWFICKRRCSKQKCIRTEWRKYADGLQSLQARQ